MTPRELAPALHSLPPILDNMPQTPTSSCSKGSRGLSVQPRVLGIFTETTVSPDPSLRQRPSRYAIRAGRNFAFDPPFPEAQTIPSPWRSCARIDILLRRHNRRCTPRVTRDCAKGRRLIAFIDYRGNAGRNCDLMSKKDNQSLRGQTLSSRLPTGLPFRCYGVLDAPRTRRASPLLAGCPLESLPARAIQLPDKEFRYLRTVIVTAAVYRGLDSRLRPKANLSS